MGGSIINIDITPPILTSQHCYWRFCDIKNHDHLSRICNQFNPTHVFHLAAKANLEGKRIEDYPDNVIGTANVIKIVNSASSLKRFVYMSTQYVVRPGVHPPDETFLLPYTAYGASKALTEKLVRNQCNKNWIILRPTNIWGPLHPFFPGELWPYIQKRYYLHPGYKPIVKYYGYVENAVQQIITIGINTLAEDVHRRVFYITDAPIDNFEWFNGFSLSLSKKPVRRIPIVLWKYCAAIGDIMRRISMPFPMTTERLFRLTINESVLYEKTLSLVGKPSICLHEGIQRSVEWYQSKTSDKAEKGASIN